MLAGRRILLVEDDAIMGASLAQRLELEGATVRWVKQVVLAIPEIRVARTPVDAVVCDIKLPDGTGEEIFARVSTTMTPPPFLFITGQGTIDQAVRLMHAGAADYITKPFEMQVFLERLALLMRPWGGAASPPMLGVSHIARRLSEGVIKAAHADENVVIVGGPGTGKGAIARLIHERSDRRSAPLIEVNVARHPDPAEALFGKERAVGRTDDGVLLLRAIERMQPSLQSELFKAMDRGFKGRVIATSEADLAAMHREGKFRPDLVSRLAEIEIAVPALKDRTDDAVWMLTKFFEAFNAQRSVPLKGMSALTEEAARAYDWPDNGREVRNRVKRAVEAANGEWLFPADLFPETQSDPSFLTLMEAREAAERRQIIAALDRTGGQMMETARLLKISRTTLWERMQKFGL